MNNDWQFWYGHHWRMYNRAANAARRSPVRGPYKPRGASWWARAKVYS